MHGMNIYVKKCLLIIICIFLIDTTIYSAAVSDNDGAAFITKGEFDTLKTNFQSQIDGYNVSIDSKIDAAIATYLAGMKKEQSGTYANLYEQYNCGTDFVWRNNIGNRTSNVLGGSDEFIYVQDIRSERNSTFGNTNNYTNDIFIATGDDYQVYLKLRRYIAMFNSVAMISFAQNSTSTKTNMTIANLSATTAASASRDGNVKVNNEMGTTWPYVYVWTAYITESITKIDSLKSNLSINRSSTEYYIKEDGDTNSTITLDTYDTKNVTPTGNYTVAGSQQFIKTFIPNWQKTRAHNRIRIYEWCKNTKQTEEIGSGAPVAYVTNDNCQVTVKLSTDVAGTIYLYSSELPKLYDTLSNGENVTIVDVTSAVTDKNVVIDKCNKGEYIRVMFLPESTSVNGILNISQITYNINED